MSAGAKNIGRLAISLRLAAIALGLVLIVLTVVPAAERPETGLQHDVEHFGAFLLLGLFAALGFRTKLLLMLIGSIVFAAAIECAQIPLATRHARLEDFLVDAAGLCAGMILGHVAARRHLFLL